MHNLREFAELANKRCETGTSQFGKRAHTVCKGNQLIAVRCLDLAQRRRKCGDLVRHGTGDFDGADLTQTFQPAGQGPNLLNFICAGVLQSLVQGVQLPGSSAQSRHAPGCGRFQTNQGILQLFQGRYGAVAVFLNLKLNTLDFHIIRHSCHLPARIVCCSRS